MLESVRNSTVEASLVQEPGYEATSKPSSVRNNCELVYTFMTSYYTEIYVSDTVFQKFLEINVHARTADTRRSFRPPLGAGNQARIMHESKGQHIGEDPSLHLFHTELTQCC